METKLCSKCKEYLPATTEFFHKDKRRPDGFFPYCKRCRVKDKQRYDEKQRYKNLPYKHCPDCDEWKHHDEFYPNLHNKDGLHTQCKGCAKNRARQWGIKYPNKYREKILNRYWNDPEGCKARFRAYYQDNREEMIQRSRDYYWANREKSLVSARRWRKKHPGIIRALAQRRRAKIKGNGGSFTAEEWRALCEKYDNKCLCCGRNDVPLTVDHVIPISKGGSNDIKNCQPLCKQCNSKKHTETIDYRDVK